MGSGFFLLCLVIFLLALVTEDTTFLITSVKKKLTASCQPEP